jgi:hypothetical protein
MQETPDNILEQALYKLACGEDISAITAEFSDYPNLHDELEVVSLLKTIPIAQAPMPTMHYRYADRLSVWQKLASSFHAYRFAAIPLVIALFLGSGFTVIQASENSLPGEKLYGIKVATEQARLQLTFDEGKQASFHVELAKKRLDEAKQAIALNDPIREVAALDALAKQTDLTFEATSQLAASQAVDGNDSSLLDNLVALNKEQKTVLASAAQSPEAKDVAETALNSNKENDKDLARLIAAVNEQTLLNLPNKISVTGLISNSTKTSVTVEKNSFAINPETVVLNQDGDVLIDHAVLSGQVAVIGTRTNNTLVAKKIVVIDPDAVLPAEPVATTSPVTPSAPATEPVATPPTEPVVQQPSEATAGFIVEPAGQQYAP